MPEKIGQDLTKALLFVQQSLDAVSKTGQNPHLKTTYATLPDVLDELLPKCHAAGLFILQRTLDTDNLGVLKLETLVIHAESGESLSEVTPMPVPQSGAQAYGSALTYARRYALMSLFGMKSVDDDGHDATAPLKAERQPQPQRQSTPPARPQSSPQPRAGQVPAHGGLADAKRDFYQRAYELGLIQERPTESQVVALYTDVCRAQFVEDDNSPKSWDSAMRNLPEYKRSRPQGRPTPKQGGI